MQKTVFVTGTGAGVGKTVVTLAIASYIQTYMGDKPLSVFKPVDAGSGDGQRYHDCLGLDASPEAIAPCQFQQAIAPPLASEQEGIPVNLAEIWRRYQALHQASDFVLVEACGGLGTPLTRETTVADLAWDWRLPTLLVVPVQVGMIGQVVAHVALARQSRLHLKGLILNSVQPLAEGAVEALAPIDLIQSLAQVPVLGHVPYLDDVGDRAKLAHVAAQLDIDRILPSIY